MLGRNLLGSFIVLQGNRAELETECLSACLIYLIYDGWLCITSLKNKQTNKQNLPLFCSVICLNKNFWAK